MSLTNRKERCGIKVDDRIKKSKLRKALKIPDASFKQRMALSNMYTALGWSLKDIRNMNVREANEAIDRAKQFIKENGFPRRSNEEE